MSWYDEQCDEVMKNPNLYVELATSGQGGYLLAEDGSLLLTEAGDNFITQNG